MEEEQKNKARKPGPLYHSLLSGKTEEISFPRELDVLSGRRAGGGILCS